jgi:hypothetical protein
VVTGAI